MPYFITDKSPDCSGWAVVKEDGEVMGCHGTKADAVEQMVAISVAEGMDPGGERSEKRVAGGDPAIIADIDGTIITNDGRPIRNVINYLNSADAEIYVITARVEDDGVSEQELIDAGLRSFDLEMKPDRSMDSVEFKKMVAEEILQEYDVLMAVDNDPAMRRMYSSLGIPTKTPSSLRSVRQVELNVPAYIRSAATRGLELRADGFGGDGLVERTIREARLMADGQISEDKVIRANAWAQRHAVDLDVPQNSNAGNENWPGAGAVAHYLWGINPLNPGPARDWFSRKAEEIQAERSENQEGLTEKENDMEDSEFRFEAPRDNLVRKVEFRAEPSSDGLTLEGYAAVFNEWTQIDSYEGTFQERIAPGAFKKTISERMPVLQFDHGTHPLIGSIPLGVITSLREDEHGLKVKARLSDNWLVEPVRDAIRDGAIQGMSFRFRVINDKWTRGKNGPERTINEIALYEAGPVVFPAYEQTSVGVRSREVLTSLSDPEVRGEIAKLLAFGTDPSVAETTEEVEPQEHSIRTKAQRQAIARLKLQGTENED